MAVTPPGDQPPLQPSREPDALAFNLKKEIDGFVKHAQDVLNSPHLVDSAPFLTQFANQVKSLHNIAQQAARQ